MTIMGVLRYRFYNLNNYLLTILKKKKSAQTGIFNYLVVNVNHIIISLLLLLLLFFFINIIIIGKVSECK